MADEAVEHGGLASALHGNRANRNESDRVAATARGFKLAWRGTYDVAERDGVEEGGWAARGGLVGWVIVGEEGGGLPHGLGELDELVDGLHGCRRRHGRRDLEDGLGDLGGGALGDWGGAVRVRRNWRRTRGIRDASRGL